MKIAKESWILAAIGLADLFTTMTWVQNQGAAEGNPIFQYYLLMGPFWFALIKVVMIVSPIFLLEWARRHRPVFTAWASRGAILAYFGLYIVGVGRLNPQIVASHIPGSQVAMEDTDTGGYAYIPPLFQAQYRKPVHVLMSEALHRIPASRETGLLKNE
jgi:hypothetical protein